MIISHRHRFIFIKTLKTAGTSIEVYLSQHCGDDDILTPIEPPVAPHVARNHRGIWNFGRDLLSSDRRGIIREFKDIVRLRKFYNHIPARRLRARIPNRIWNDYFKFCVERNPWDKTLSDYFMTRDRSGGEMSLDQYLAAGRFAVNYPQYTGADGKIIVDRVLKYENLLPELGAVFEELGVPFQGSLGVSAKSEHRRDRSPYQETLSREQCDYIGKVFAHEIALHGYRF